MNVDIEKKSQNCTTCLKYRPAQCKESYHEDHDVLVVRVICAQMGRNPKQIAIVINYIPNESS